MKRIKLIIAYDGSRYHGWQTQPNAISIEQVLNKAIKKLTGEDVCVMGASRTDAGVHARGNVAVFDTQSRIPGEKFAFGLNQRLPHDVVVQSSSEVSTEFHPRYCKCRKTYEYTIVNRLMPLPEYRDTGYYYYGKVDIASMKEACKYFIGEHDFTSFCAAGAQVKTRTREIYSLEIEEEPLVDRFNIRNQEEPNRIIRVRVTGNGFLYNMVRIIVGTLIHVGTGKLKPEDIQPIMDSYNRKKAGPTAPAAGLKLMEIQFLDPPEELG